MPTKKKLTPEEEAARQQRVDAGNDYIQQREQRASKLAESGFGSLKASRAQAAKELTAKAEATPESPTRTLQEVQQTAGEFTALQERQQAELDALTQKYLTSTPEERADLELRYPELKGTFEGFIGNKATPFLEKVVGLTGGGTERDAEGNLRITGKGKSIATAAGIGAGATLAPVVFSGAAAKVGATGGIVSKLATHSKFLGGLILGGGVSTAIRSLTAGKVSEIEGDISEIRTSTRDIVTDVTKGGDPQQAIDALQEIENSMYALEGDLHQALKTDLQARLRGKDTEEFMFRNLNAVIRRRQALERYMIDGNIDNLNLILGETEIVE